MSGLVPCFERGEGADDGHGIVTACCGEFRELCVEVMPNLIAQRRSYTAKTLVELEVFRRPESGEPCHRFGDLMKGDSSLDETLDAAGEWSVPDFGHIEQMRIPLEVLIGGRLPEVIERFEVSKQ